MKILQREEENKRDKREEEKEQEGEKITSKMMQTSPSFLPYRLTEILQKIAIEP